MSTFTSAQPEAAVCPEAPFAARSGALLSAVAAELAPLALSILMPALPAPPTRPLGRFLPEA
jgi:hypothetical protein